MRPEKNAAAATAAVAQLKGQTARMGDEEYAPNGRQSPDKSVGAMKSVK